MASHTLVDLTQVDIGVIWIIEENEEGSCESYGDALLLPHGLLLGYMYEILVYRRWDYHISLLGYPDEFPPHKLSMPSQRRGLRIRL